MENSRKLYVMISKTNTRIGGIIRVFSRFEYNHVSISLDPAFQVWYSFARYVQDTPLYGGFVSETLKRYTANGNDSNVRIFCLNISKKKYEHLQNLFTLADNPDCGLIYNYLDIFAALFHLKINIPGAYTCLGFACAVLDKSYMNIKEINCALSPYLIYDGHISKFADNTDSQSSIYFSKLGLIHGTAQTIKQFATLSARIFDKNYVDIVTKE